MASQLERLNEIDRQPPWRLTHEWIAERINLTQAYLGSFKHGYAPNRAPDVILRGDQLLALLYAADQSERTK